MMHFGNSTVIEATPREARVAFIHHRERYSVIAASLPLA
jgi:hypothetical protein